MLEEIEKESQKIIKELSEKIEEKTKIKEGSLLVIGCSTSEVIGGNISKNSSEDVAKAIYNGIKEERQQKQIDLKIYDNKILTFLPKPHILSWEKEGIKKEVCDYHNICYNPSSQAIVIPHYDKDNNLIGIRERTLIKENEVYGKYRPAYINKQMYNHPLGFALYNLNNSKDNIKKMKKVIIFERRKV